MQFCDEEFTLPIHLSSDLIHMKLRFAQSVSSIAPIDKQGAMPSFQFHTGSYGHGKFAINLLHTGLIKESNTNQTKFDLVPQPPKGFQTKRVN